MKKDAQGLFHERPLTYGEPLQKRQRPVWPVLLMCFKSGKDSFTPRSGIRWC